MSITDPVAYVYWADIYCPACVVEILNSNVGDPVPTYDSELALDRLSELFNVYRYDEQSYDSSEFPKSVFYGQLDGDERCGSCEGNLAFGPDVTTDPVFGCATTPDGETISIRTTPARLLRW